MWFGRDAKLVSKNLICKKRNSRRRATKKKESEWEIPSEGSLTKRRGSEGEQNTFRKGAQYLQGRGREVPFNVEAKVRKKKRDGKM